MARIHIRNMVDKLDSDIKRALEDAVNEVLPNVSIDRNDLFRAFRRALERRCSTWEDISEGDVQKHCIHCQEYT